MKGAAPQEIRGVQRRRSNSAELHFEEIVDRRWKNRLLKKKR